MAMSTSRKVAPLLNGWRKVTPLPKLELAVGVPNVIEAVIFDYGGVISSPLFVGIGAFEEAEGYPKGSLLQLLFGETHYIGVEGRAVLEPDVHALVALRDAGEPHADARFPQVCGDRKSVGTCADNDDLTHSCPPP